MRFAHPRQPASYAGMTRRLRGCPEPLAPVFMPAAHELGREGGLLPGAHRSYELFGELAADDPKQSLVWRRSIPAPVALADDVPEHHVHELGCPTGLLHVSRFGIERARRAPRHVDGSEPTAKRKVVDHI